MQALPPLRRASIALFVVWSAVATAQDQLIPTLPEYPSGPPADLAGAAPAPETTPVMPTSDADIDKTLRDAVGVPPPIEAPPADLAAPVSPPSAPPAAARTSPYGLDLAVTGRPTVAGQTLASGAPRKVRLTVANRDAATMPRATLVVQLDNARLETPGAWRANGPELRSEIGPLAPGARASVDLDLRSGDAPTAGQSEAQVRAELRTRDGRPDGEAVLAWTVRDCVGAFRERLMAVRSGPFAAFRSAAQVLRRGDPTLPTGLMFRASMQRGGSNAARLAAGLAGRHGADPDLAREPLSFTVLRISYELDGYLNQRAFPGLCAGAERVASAYRAAFAPVEKRLTTLRRGAEEARGGVSGNTADSLATRARAAAIAAGLLGTDAPTDVDALAVLGRARAAMRAGTALSAEANEALSAIEIEAWLSYADASATRVSNTFAATLNGIVEGRRDACTCAP